MELCTALATFLAKLLVTPGSASSITQASVRHLHAIDHE